MYKSRVISHDRLQPALSALVFYLRGILEFLHVLDALYLHVFTQVTMICIWGSSPETKTVSSCAAAWT